MTPARRNQKPGTWKGAAALRPLLVAIDSLQQDARNPRRHSARNLEAIAASLRTFGQQKPIVVRKANRSIVAGNGTVQAAQSLGWTAVAAVVEDLTEAQARAFAVADNRTAELAEWDRENLGAILGDDEIGQLLDSTGFTASEIDELLRAEVPGAAGETENDSREDAGTEAEQEPEQPAIAKVGDLWICGRHQVLCAPQKSRGGAAWVRDQKAAAALLTADDRPVEERERALEQLLKATAPDGAVVLDVDGRDGALLMACERVGRTARVLARDPHHVDLIVARWERQTGGKAERKKVSQRKGATAAAFVVPFEHVYPPDSKYHGD